MSQSGMRMLTLSYDEMIILSGGGWKNKIDCACFGVGIASVLKFGNPYASAFCVGWAIGRGNKAHCSA